MSTNPFSPRPAFHKSIIQLACVQCGAEANASCSCGKPYVPVQQRVAEYDKANPGKSTRQAAAELGVSHEAVRQARGVNQLTPDIVTGRDNKQYPAKAPKRQPPSYIPDDETLPPDPSADEDLIDQIVNLFEQLSKHGKVRCGVRLNEIMDVR